MYKYKIGVSMDIVLTKPKFPPLSVKDLLDILEITPNSRPFKSDIENIVFQRICSTDEERSIFSSWNGAFMDTQEEGLKRDENQIIFYDQFVAEMELDKPIPDDLPFASSVHYMHDYTVDNLHFSHASLRLNIEFQRIN